MLRGRNIQKQAIKNVHYNEKLFLKIVRLTKVCIRDNVLTKMLECYR